MYRINTIENRLEYSKTGGTLWVGWGRLGSKFGRIKDILWFHNQLFALTETGLWSSRNGGADWGLKGSSSIVKNLVAIQDGGRSLYGVSADGHFWISDNEGAYWGRRG